MLPILPQVGPLPPVCPRNIASTTSLRSLGQGTVCTAKKVGGCLPRLAPTWTCTGSKLSGASTMVGNLQPGQLFCSTHNPTLKHWSAPTVHMWRPTQDVRRGVVNKRTGGFDNVVNLT